MDVLTPLAFTQLQRTLIDNQPKVKLTFLEHSLGHALLKAAILAPVSIDLIHLAVTVPFTRVLQLLLYRPFKKSFTPLACKHTIMIPCGFIVADHALSGRTTGMGVVCPRADITLLAVDGRARFWRVCCWRGSGAARVFSREFASGQIFRIVVIWFGFGEVKIHKNVCQVARTCVEGTRVTLHETKKIKKTNDTNVQPWWKRQSTALDNFSVLKAYYLVVSTWIVTHANSKTLLQTEQSDLTMFQGKVE